LLLKRVTVLQVKPPVFEIFGQHTRAVLSQLGYNATEIDALFAAGVAINQ
jgi:crotonobetainyl-CoA:carnitine CoA-transferase CaiB-like acyl-CoA transferase